MTAPAPAIGGYNVYYGNLHAHTSVSDGKGSLDDAFSHARDIAGLDFFGVSEHDYFPDDMTSKDWRRIQKTADEFNEDGSFVAFPGYEWTSDSTSSQRDGLNQGHLTVVGTYDFCSAAEDCRTLDQFVKWLDRQKRGIAIMNHPGEYGATFDFFNFRHSNKIVGIELWNRNKDYFSEYGYEGHGFYDEALKKGWHVGAGGGQDNHDKSWGTQNPFRHAVLATSKTRASIFEALESRRFFSTLDSNLALSFECNGLQMGSFVHEGTLSCIIETFDGSREKFRRIYLIKNGKTIKKWKSDDFADDSHPWVTYKVEDVSEGDYLYVRVHQNNEDTWAAISSPFFVTGAATHTPTGTPTKFPTDTPTHAPSRSPTTTRRTFYPSGVPSELPTIDLTEEPSELPTITLTEEPSESPLAEPTLLPTINPTPLPTIIMSTGGNPQTRGGSSLEQISELSKGPRGVDYTAYPLLLLILLIVMLKLY